MALSPLCICKIRLPKGYNAEYLTRGIVGIYNDTEQDVNASIYLLVKKNDRVIPLKRNPQLPPGATLSKEVAFTWDNWYPDWTVHVTTNGFEKNVLVPGISNVSTIVPQPGWYNM